MKKYLKVLVVSLLILIFILSSVAMINSEDLIAKSKEYNKTAEKITIRNVVDNSIQAEYTLLKNSCDKDFRFCEAIIKTNFLKESKPFDSIEFNKIIGNQFFEGKVRWMNIYLNTEGQKIDVNDYGWICLDQKGQEIKDNQELIKSNSTDCHYVITGTHKENAPDWTFYNNQKFKEKEQIWKITVEKRPSWKIDWILNTFGVKLTEWAIWGSIAGGDQAEINLTSPSNGSLVSASTVFLNYTTKLTTSAYIKEAYLLGNFNGNWHINQTKVFNIIDGVNLYYSLDDGTGTNVNEDFTGLYDATLIGSPLPLWVDGKYGKALRFNGTKDTGVNITNFPKYNATGNTTWSAWINYAGSTEYATVISSQTPAQWNGIKMVFDASNNKPYCEYTNASPQTWTKVYAVNNISLSTWHMITCNLNVNGNLSIYIDGLYNNSIATTGGYNIGRRTLIGSTDDAGYSFNESGIFKGDIDEVAIWNRSLTANEILQLYSDPVLVKNYTGSFNITSTSETNNWWTIGILDSDGVTGYPVNNASFIYDGVSPNISIISPTGTLTSKTFLINISAVDNSLISSCMYNITRGASTEIANTFLTAFNSSRYYNETVTVSSDATYSLNLMCNDTGNNKNITNQTFIVNTVVIPPSGGGGSPTVTITGEAGWTMEVSEGNALYTINVPVGTSRKLGIDFENIGESSRRMILSCENTFGNICQYVSFEENPFDLPLIKDTKIKKYFVITIPSNLEKSNYSFNIKATDDLGRSGVISVQMNTDLNVFSSFFSKLTGSTKSGFPYFLIWLIALILNVFTFSFIFRDIPLRALWNAILTIIISVGVVMVL